MGLSPMGMMGAGMAFGALSGGLQSYVGGVQQNAAFTVQSANAQLQGAQTEIAAAQALVQAEDARYQATMSDVQARQRLTGTLPESIIRFSSRRLQKRGLRRARSTGRRRPTPGHAWEPPMWTPPAGVPFPCSRATQRSTGRPWQRAPFRERLPTMATDSQIRNSRLRPLCRGTRRTICVKRGPSTTEHMATR